MRVIPGEADTRRECIPLLIFRNPADAALTGAGLDALCRHDSCIVVARARHCEWPLEVRPLMLVAVRGGRELYTLGHRRVAVDDDNFLVLNAGRAHTSLIRSETLVESFRIYFRSGMVDEVLVPLVTPLDSLLDYDAPSTCSFELCEALQPHDRTVSPVLSYIRRLALAGNDDTAWFDEQLRYLLERLLLAHRAILRKVRAIPCARAGTRKEIHRRISRAVDCIESCYQEPIELETLAQAACLSKFHFLRAFRSLLGMTPQHYLQRKRAFVARRLLATTELSAADIALQVGYASRTSLARQVRHWTGVAPSEIRRRESLDADPDVVTFATT